MSKPRDSPLPDRVIDGRSTRFRRDVDRGASEFSAEFGDALRAGDGAWAESVARRSQVAGLPVAAVYARVIEPSLYLVGDLWEQGRLSVADEHLATVICHRVLAVLHSTLRGPPRNSRERVLLATPEGQRHALGLRMAADVLEGAGFTVCHLGADVPGDALKQAVRRHQPSVVGLSVTTDSGVDSLLAAIKAVHAVRPGTQILLGGQAVPRELLEAGTMFAADAEAVVPVIEELLESDSAHAAAPIRRGPRVLRAIKGPGPGPVKEQLTRAAADIGDVARDHSRLAERYRLLAFEDQLCALPNRRGFEDRFRELAEQHVPARGAPPLVVMLLDVDHFKTINDEFGHDAGDRALQRVAQTLRTQLREHDLSARLGGDEFAALLPGVEPATAMRVAERVRETISAETKEPHLTVSVGLARFDGSRRRTLISADQLLYEAKRRGGDAVLLAG